MNKQELIEAIKNEPYEKGIFVDTIKFNRNWLLRKIEKLDEPGKAQIPQFVADVIEGAREQNPELEDALHYTWGKGTKEFTEWYKKKSNRDLFARAFLEGYELEKEKRYLVKLKGVFKGYEYLNFKFGRVWTFSNEEENEEYRTCHTKKELEEAGFGWVFDCPGIDVEEVE